MFEPMLVWLLYSAAIIGLVYTGRYIYNKLAKYRRPEVKHDPKHRYTSG